jgi:hypothetical protein
MRIDFPVRVKRSTDVSTTMDGEDHPVLLALLGNKPHRGHAVRVGLDVVDLPRLGSQVAPVVRVGLLAALRRLGPARVHLTHSE